MSENPYLDTLRRTASTTGAQQPAVPAGPAANPYLETLQAQRTAENAALNGQLSQAVRVNPDQFARQRSVAQMMGYPTAAVEALPELEQQAKVDRIRGDIAGSPALQRAYTDADFARLAQDDSGVLSQIGQFVRNMGGSAKAGLYTASRGAAGTFQAGLDLLAPALDIFENPSASVSPNRVPVPFVAALPGGNPLRRLSETFAVLGGGADAVAKAARPKVEGIVPSGFFSGVESLIQNLLALPMAFAPGGQAAALTMMTAGTGGNAYQDASEKGLPMSQALPFAMSQAVIEYATEMFPLGALLKDVKAGAGFLRILGRQIALEIPGEQVATVLQDLNEWAVLNPEKPFSSYLEARPSAAAQTLVATIVGAGGNVAIVKGIEAVMSRAIRDGTDMQQATQTSQALGAALKGAQASALLKRDPAQFREVMNALAEDGVVYVDAQVLNQMPPDVLAQMEGVQAELPDALETNSPVAVKVADILTLAPGTPLAETFTQNARRTPDSPTLVETEEAGKVAGEFLKNEFDRVLAQAADTAAWQQSTQTVQQTILGELNTAGRFTPDVNEAYATLQANFFSTMAARNGMTPEALYAKWRLGVAARQPGGGGQVLNAEPTLPPENLRNLETWSGSKGIGPASEMVRVYRAVPEGSDQAAIRPGDWVSANRDYVTEYAGAGATIIESTIPANELVDAQTGAVARDTLVWTPSNPPGQGVPVEQRKPIQAAAIYVGGRIVTAPTHGQAINKAVEDGILTRDENGRLNLAEGDDVDLFITADGRAVDRFESSRLFDVSSSEGAAEDGKIVLDRAPRVWVVEELRDALQTPDFYGQPARVTTGRPIFQDIITALSLTDAEVNSTAIEFMTGLPGDMAFLPPYVGRIPDVVQFLHTRRLESGLPVLDIKKPEDRTQLARLMAAEALAAIRSAGNALTWYDQTIREMLSQMALKYPELESNPHARNAFLIAMAITSQGMNVETNLGAAIELYDAYRLTVDANGVGTFPERGWGESASQMTGNLKLANELMREMGPEMLRRFLITPFTVSELNAAGFQVNDELADEVVLGSSVFGPKIGFGFYSNLSGNFDPVTMDMWFMRTKGRLAGDLPAMNPAKFAKQLARFRAGLRQRGKKSVGIYAAQLDKDAVKAAMIDDSAAVALARKINSIHQKDFKNNRALFDSGARQKSEIVLAAGTILQSMDKPTDAPTSGGERRLLRDVVNQATALVSQHQGEKVPSAAFQALIWYPEQELYSALGVKLAVTSQDYSGGAAKILTTEGYSEQDIANARARAAAKPGSGSARSVDGQPDTGTGDGNGQVIGGAGPLTFDERARFLVERNLRILTEQRAAAARVAFEVAPDPNDAALTDQWRQLTQPQRLAISDRVARALVPKVLKFLKAKGDVLAQVGSYLQDTNPSFALRVDKGDVDRLSKILGFVLSQDAMMAIAPAEFPGSSKAQALRIEVGEKTSAEVDQIYQALRAIALPDGRQPIAGQSASGGTMTVLLDSQDDANAIAILVDQALAGAYNVGIAEVFAAFPEKQDYDYARVQDDPAGNEGLARQWARNARQEASDLLRKELDTGRGQPGANAGSDTGVLEQSPRRRPSINTLLRRSGQQVTDSVDAARRWNDGERIFGYAEQDGRPSEITSAEMLENFTADQLLALPKEVFEQPAYHGSPKRGIDQFSTDFIGTGEGAQAYGWGLYFAGRREIAEWYREKLAGEAVARVEVEEYTIAGDRNWIATTFNGSGDSLGRSDYLSDDDLRNLVGETADQIIAKSEAAPGKADGEYAVDKTPGQLYEVEIPEDSEMLLWDQPLSEQPAMLKALRRLSTKITPEMTGAQAYRNAVASVDRITDNPDIGIEDEKGLGAIADRLEIDLYSSSPGELDTPDLQRMLAEFTAKRDQLSAREWIRVQAFLGERSDKIVSTTLLAAGVKGTKYLDGGSRADGDGSFNYVVFSGDDVAIQNQFYQEQQPAQPGPRGTFNPETMLITLGETADLSTFLHESGHFFLEVLADLASQPNAPAGIAADMKSTLKWFGVKDLATWNAMTLDQKRPYHEKWAESFEQYLFEGRAPTPELQPLFRRFRSWMLNVYKSLSRFMTGRNLQVNDEVRQVFDRMLATDEQIAQAEQAAGMLPNFEATNEAIEALQARSLRDLKWTVRARGRALKALEKQAADLRKGVEAEVRAEVGQEPVYRAIRWLRTGEMTDEEGSFVKAEKGFRLNTDAIAEMYPESMLARPDLTGLKGMTSKTGLSPDLVADMFGYPSGDALVRAVLAAEPMGSVIEGITDQRMLERHGELATPEALEAAANEAVHNEARARSLATELKSQSEMMNERSDTGRTNAAGRPITVNTIVEAAKQFALNLVARRRVNDLKSAAWQHRAAEARAGKAWQEATSKGETAKAVQAKRDQLLNNYAAKALQEAEAEVRKIGEFFKRVTTGNNEKVVKGGRDPDVVNAMRAILAAYGVAPRLGKSALEYMEAVSRNDPAMYAALKPSVDGAMMAARPLGEMTMEELRGLNDELRAMWELAKRSRQMEVDGNLMDIEDAAADLVDRMGTIGIPAEIPGEKGAITDKQERGIKLRFALSILTRVEQWAERLDGKYGGPFLRLVFQPIKDAADRFRTDRVDYRKRYEALLKDVAPYLPRGAIAAPELGYTFGNARDSGAAELLHAILHTGNDSNKRKLLLGRGWATENADGTMDTAAWDTFLQRMAAEGKLVKQHYDFAQGVWDMLEQMKPLAQETHRQVYGRYFAEVTANEVVTPFGTYRGGYVPAQTDARLVKDAKLRELAEGENESMAYAFPASPSGFTKGRVEYNKPLMLDLRTLAQHMDKVLLFSHMQGAVTDVRRLLTNKSVSYALDRIDPGAYEGMLIPWLNRAARQVVETPVMGDRKISRLLSAGRSRAGMALMFANLSNTFQQITGFSMAAVKVKPGLMMKATAQFIADPKAMKTAVAEASPFMKDRMLNEISAMNAVVEEILLDPTMLERGQAWTQRHAYFMQAAVDNTMSPIIWTAAYNQAIAKGETERDAIRFADGTIRQTQGSTLPEDISRFESGPAYGRLFTQFVSYFNMMANTNATAISQIVGEMGLRKGAGKVLYVALAGLLVPIWVAEAIAHAFRGGPEDEDDDGYLDDWLMAVFGLGTIRGLVAQVPIAGQAAQLVVNRFNDNPADDKFSLSPAVSLIESTVSAPSSVYKAIVEDGNKQKAVRDVAAAATMITGLPIFALGRPLGYLAGMADDRIEPTGPADMVRGLVTGTASPESKVP